MSDKKILIVDDEEDILSLLQKRLHSAGYECIGKKSVEEALESIRFEQPELIILDLSFAGASGIALLQNLARYLPDAEKMPPVVVLSAYGDPEIVDYVRDLGAVDFIKKPFDSQQIVSSVRTWLRPGSQAV